MPNCLVIGQQGQDAEDECFIRSVQVHLFVDNFLVFFQGAVNNVAYFRTKITFLNFLKKDPFF